MTVINMKGGSSVVAELTKLYNRLPWPQYVAINGTSWNELKSELPEAPKDKGGATMVGDVPFRPFGLQIVVDETVPPNEIHLQSVVHENGETRLRIDKIINIGGDIESS